MNISNHLEQQTRNSNTWTNVIIELIFSQMCHRCFVGNFFFLLETLSATAITVQAVNVCSNASINQFKFLFWQNVTTFHFESIDKSEACLSVNSVPLFIQCVFETFPFQPNAGYCLPPWPHPTQSLSASILQPLNESPLLELSEQMESI